MPPVRRQNAPAGLSGDGIEGFAPVLPQMQVREHRQHQKFYHGNHAARRQDAVLIAKPIMYCVLFFKEE